MAQQISRILDKKEMHPLPNAGDGASVFKPPLTDSSYVLNILTLC